MGDLKIAETFQDAVFITNTISGKGVTGLIPVCSFIKIADGTRTIGTVQEVGGGWYRVTDFTNDAAGSWVTEWAVTGPHTIHGKIKEFKVGLGQLQDIYDLLTHMHTYNDHLTAIFPEDTDEIVTVTSGVGANTFGAWANLVDNNAVTLSSKFAASDGYISAMHVEDANSTDNLYLLELRDAGTGDIITRIRFSKALVKSDVSHAIGVRSEHIPLGADIEYRMKDATGSKTAELHIRYYLV